MLKHITDLVTEFCEWLSPKDLNAKEEETREAERRLRMLQMQAEVAERRLRRTQAGGHLP